MAHDLPTLLSEHTKQLDDEAPWIWLYEIEVPGSPPTRYRLTNHPRSVSFGTSSNGSPLVYSPFPIVHGDIRETSEGDLPSIQLQVGYPSLELVSVMEENDGLIGEPVVVRLVNRDQLDDVGAQIRFDGQVIAAKVTAGSERLAVTVAAYNIQRKQFPGERFIGRHCRFRYGGPDCGYDLTNATLAAAFPTCPKTLDACRDRGAAELGAGLEQKHPRRFGGWPSIPRRR